jgi:hypothetical protein
VAEIDVLAVSGTRPVLVGECRWQAKPVTGRDLAERAYPDVWVFTLADLLR